MKHFALIWLLAAWQLIVPCQADSFSLPGYQHADGSISVTPQNDTIDPYFASKALLAAHAAQADARQAAFAWIRWVLPFQRDDGRFDRLCKRGERYAACGAADADDALLAVWIELLATFAPRTGMPAEWQNSLAKAEAYLSSLRDPRTSVYAISKDLPVALLMDNIEVYSAFNAMSAFHARHGNMAEARRWRAAATRLSDGISRVFWSGSGFRVSTQDHKVTGFYPDAVAQIFPLLAGFRIPGHDAKAVYGKWMRENREIWLEQVKADFPWALIALIAYWMGDADTVLCWRARVEPFRHSKHWNVLEESIYSALVAQFSERRLLAPACGA